LKRGPVDCVLSLAQIARVLGTLNGADAA
jgi:hypothetical protein